VLTLALDTSSPSGSLAVLRDEKLIGAVSTSTGEVYSSRMFRELDFLLAELALRMESFDLFAVAAGPGSFTGLRVGLTAVKGWSEVYQKPVAAVSALAAVAVQAPTSVQTVVPVLDARRSQLYFGFYRRDPGPRDAALVLDGEEYVMDPSELLAAIRARARGDWATIITPSPELIADALKGSPDITLQTASPVLAPFIGQLGLQRARDGNLADPLTLDANYVRRSDAEMHWKES